MRIASVLLAVALATTGCKKKENKPTDNAGSGSAMVGSGSDMGSGSAAAGSGSDTGSGAAMAGSGSADTGAGSAMAGSGDGPAMTKRAGNCPSAALGATTKAAVKGKDVVVTITSTDKDAIAAIQARADELL